MKTKLLNFFARLALCFWLGEMLFFAFIFAPRVFKILERPDTAKLQEQIFPAYYIVGFACSLILLVYASSKLKQTTPQLSTFKNQRLPILLIVYGGLVFASCAWIITPHIIELQGSIGLQDPALMDLSKKAEFTFLHKLSTGLNMSVLLALLALLVLLPL